MNKRVFKLILLLTIIALAAALLSACSDNKEYLVIVEKGDTQLVSFAKSILSNNENNIKFIDENNREQSFTGDYIMTTTIKKNDEDLIIVKNNDITSLIFPVKILHSSLESVTYLYENGEEQTASGEITIINIRDSK
jgi:hypothetical protein